MEVYKMKKSRKIIVLLSTLILLISFVTLAYALSQSQQKTVHVSGSASYPATDPSNSPTATPTAVPSALQFSLWFPNGTAFPTSISNPIMNVIAGNPNPSPNPPQAAPSYTLTFVAKNDGTVPVNITIAGANVVLPANIAMGFGFDPSTSSNGDSVVIAVGQSQTLTIDFYMTTSTTLSFTPGAAFNYSFDLTVTGIQAN